MTKQHQEQKCRATQQQQHHQQQQRKFVSNERVSITFMRSIRAKQAFYCLYTIQHECMQIHITYVWHGMAWHSIARKSVHLGQEKRRMQWAVLCLLQKNNICICVYEVFIEISTTNQQMLRNLIIFAVIYESRPHKGHMSPSASTTLGGESTHASKTSLWRDRWYFWKKNLYWLLFFILPTRQCDQVVRILTWSAARTLTNNNNKNYSKKSESAIYIHTCVLSKCACCKKV